MLVQRKKYRLVKNTYISVNLINLLKQNCLLHFYFIKHINSLTYSTLKTNLNHLNSRLLYCKSILLKKEFFTFNVSSFYIDKLFINNIIVVYTKDHFRHNSHKNFFIELISKKINMSLLYLCYSKRFLFSSTLIKYHLLSKEKVIISLLFILLNSNAFFYMALYYYENFKRGQYFNSI